MRKLAAIVLSVFMFLGTTAGAGAATTTTTRANDCGNPIAFRVNEGANAAAGVNLPLDCSKTSSFTPTTPTSNTNNSQPSTSTNTGTNTGNGLYVAMGDSVAAGLGLAPLSNATSADTNCGRSSQGYPNLVAQQKGMQLMNLACSGATAGDLYSNSSNGSTQLDAAFSQGTPRLITITTGANDVHWADFIRACYATDCATALSNGLARFYLTGLQPKLNYILGQIQSRSNGSPPTVILTGYYNPVSNYCKNRQNLVSNNEIDFLNTQRDALNKVIRDTASQYSFAKYASSNFNGHGLCSTDPWAQNLNQAAPLHPTVAGQQQIANSVLQAI